MTTWNLNWYNQNSTRRYPLDDSVSGESTDGAELPDNLLVDAHLRFPRTAGEYAWIGSVHVSDKLVSVTVLAAADLTGSGTSVLLATFSAPKSSVTPYVQYPLTPAYPGTGGWLVFGSGLETVTFRGGFAGPTASGLLPRVARAYAPLPVSGTHKLAVQPALTGLVQLRAGTDLEIVGETRTIENKQKRVIAVRLVKDPNRNLLKEYAGPCGGRPESETCIKTPIETINAVAPDCNGNITLQFTRDCVKVAEVLPPSGSLGSGIDLDYCLGLDSACTKKRRLPVNGVLPNEYPSDCDLRDPSVLPPPGSDSESETFPPSSSCQGTTSLPYIDNFNDGEAQNFVTQSGIFLEAGVTYNANSIILRNTAVWKPCNPTWTNLKSRQVLIDFILTDAGTNPNGGLVTGWRIQGGTETFFVAELHQPSGEFRIAYWTGNQFLVKAVGAQLAISTNKLYRIVLTHANTTNYGLTAVLYDDANAALATVRYDSPAIPYMPGDHVGLNAVQATTRFDYFKMS